MSEVCKICFNSSSHKTNPTLTPESKAIIDPSTKEKTCPSCKQVWNGLQVAKDRELNKWVPIRPRPKISPFIDYQLCASVQRKINCPKGQAGCTYAHSKAELLSWNKDRWKEEARPVPSANAGPYQYQLCKHVMTEGICPYGQRCTFAHSEEELQTWIHGYKIENPPPALLSQPPLQLSMQEFCCRACDLRCTSHKQLEEHLSGTKHKQTVASRVLPYQAMPLSHIPPSHPSYPTSMPGPLIRSRPNRFPVHGYRLCNSLVNGRRCFYGEACSFAHSQMELDTWNQELQTIR